MAFDEFVMRTITKSASNITCNRVQKFILSVSPFKYLGSNDSIINITFFVSCTPQGFADNPLDCTALKWTSEEISTDPVLGKFWNPRQVWSRRGCICYTNIDCILRRTLLCSAQSCQLASSYGLLELLRSAPSPGKRRLIKLSVVMQRLFTRTLYFHRSQKIIRDEISEYRVLTLIVM